MRGFLLFNHPHDRDREVIPTVHRSVRAAVDFSLRDGGRIYRPPGDEELWVGPVRQAIETDTIEDNGTSYYGPRLEYVVVRGDKTDVVAIRPCEVVL